MDTIQIRGLRVEAVIGVHAWERKLPRPLVIDLELATDVARAAGSDQLADALDYQALSDAAMKFVAESHFQLVESLAERLAAQLRRDFHVRWLRLTIHKPGAVAAAQDVSVTVERGEKA